jgi:hypothetical protein
LYGGPVRARVMVRARVRVRVRASCLVDSAFAFKNVRMGGRVALGFLRIRRDS